MAEKHESPVPCNECARRKKDIDLIGEEEVVSCEPTAPGSKICTLITRKKTKPQGAVGLAGGAAPLISVDELDRAVPLARYEDLVLYAPHLDEGMKKFAIDTPARISAFVAQVAHESGDFLRVEENLNYSAQGLRATWPNRFASDAFAQDYHRQPEKIANYVYGGRNGNGDEASGDGWRYRGRGLIQVTGRTNYAGYAQAIGDPSVVANPAQLAQPRHAALSACWFWGANKLNVLADLGTEAAFNDISHKINGGWNGKADRLENWAQAKAVLVA